VNHKYCPSHLSRFVVSFSGGRHKMTMNTGWLENPKQGLKNVTLYSCPYHHHTLLTDFQNSFKLRKWLTAVPLNKVLRIRWQLVVPEVTHSSYWKLGEPKMFASTSSLTESLTDGMVSLKILLILHPSTHSRINFRSWETHWWGFLDWRLQPLGWAILVYPVSATWWVKTARNLQQSSSKIPPHLLKYP